MTGKIITISRQFGSGGHSIAEMTAQKLGLERYGREIIEQISARSGFAEDYVNEQSESADAGGIFGAIASTDYYESSNRIAIWTEQCKVIREMADKGPCVFVGRCADYVLKQDYDLLRVFIYADMEYRADRIVRVYGQSDIKPEKRLKEKDKRRAAYYEIYTDQKFGDPKNYDLCLNSGRIGLEESAELIADLYRKLTKAE
ncbi:MAG: cytidylate kinase-like family protein [Solobacterium sp.]|jgi:cytidylate kinase|nr:cytidylate kinase-like family protein [Solobacterium sp.]MCH4205747.1 cytidylate kinase-like family protein [Solobacterium sp.]MCH4227271.1 cytidylate kinase-like family protein [Solobacterium sp.]